MIATITEIHSIRDAIRSMYFSKRSWNFQKEVEIYNAVAESTIRRGFPISGIFDDPPNFELSENQKAFKDMVSKLFKWGKIHPTLLRFIDLSVTVQGLHRGAVDDFDSHAKRLENRIIRSSTRLGKYEAGEMSDWYKEKIIPTDAMAEIMDFELPETVTLASNGQTYTKTVNGYIRKDLAGNKDVERGLLMLSIPMDFTFKCNIAEWAHIYRERGQHSNAAPELKEMVESVTDQLNSYIPHVTREYLMEVRQ